MYYDLFKDREEAGALLAEKLLEYENTNSIILAIPRGGVPVGYVISQKLNLPLDIILSKKIPHPYNKELAIGAVTMDAEIVDYYPNISKNYINSEVSRIREVLKKKLNLYVKSTVMYLTLMPFCSLFLTCTLWSMPLPLSQQLSKYPSFTSTEEYLSSLARS